MTLDTGPWASEPEMRFSSSYLSITPYLKYTLEHSTTKKLLLQENRLQPQIRFVIGNMFTQN